MAPVSKRTTALWRWSVARPPSATSPWTATGRAAVIPSPASQRIRSTWWMASQISGSGLPGTSGVPMRIRGLL